MAERVSPIAIIGAGCRFPGSVSGLSRLDALLRNGVDAVSEIPPDRWSMLAFASDTTGVQGKTYSRWGGFVSGIDQFEPEAFGISPREAAFVDPQQRMLLEVVWEALEDASIPLSELAGSRTGVFVGISTFDYAQLQATASSKRTLQAFTALGTSLSIAANRISYCLDVHGPSFAVDTACSSSLVALDRAVKSLRAGECDTAIVGGVNALLLPDVFISFCSAAMLSPDGRCKAFDASANGFVCGEGAGAVVLRSAARARAEGNRIHAVVIGSGINQDGRTTGLAMPNRQAQVQLLRDVYSQANIDPARVTYVEAHGTGTAIGDRVEAHSLGEVFSPARNGDPLVIGSIKTNIGHLEAGSGMAGLLKAVLLLKHRTIYRNLHFRQPNPRIPFEALKLRVPTETETWRQDGSSLVGVNSFGFGGTNAHVILADSEYAASRKRFVRPRKPLETRPYVLPVTARSDSALLEAATSFRDALPRTGSELTAFCRTAALRRTHYPVRMCAVGKNAGELIANLTAFVGGQRAPNLQTGTVRAGKRPLVFVFCGQGPQHPGMGLDLFDREPVFRKTARQCDEMLSEYLGWSVLGEIRRAADVSRIDQTCVAQPALFTVQAALAALWASWGVKPDAVLGHSVGEVAAAWASGALDLETACRIVAVRSRAMQDARSGGKMIAATIDAAEAESRVRRYLPEVCIAAVNGPRQVTLSGEPHAIEALEAELQSAGLAIQFLRVSHAFHSPAMDSAEAPLRKHLRDVKSAAPQTRFISTVTGKEMHAGNLNADYWWRNVRRPVLFDQAIRTVLDDGAEPVVVEIGPQPVIGSSVKDIARAVQARIDVFPSLQKTSSDAIFRSVCALFTSGVPIDWNELLPGSGEPVELPPHPWRRERYWSENPEVTAVLVPQRYHPLLGFRRTSGVWAWEQCLDTKSLTWLSDHRVKGSSVLPGAAFVELMLAAVAESRDRQTSSGLCLQNVQFQRALFFGTEPPTVQVTVAQEERTVSVHSRIAQNDASWLRNAIADWSTVEPLRPAPIEVDSVRKRFTREVPAAEAYEQLEQFGLDYGPAFQSLRTLWRSDNEAFGHLALNPSAGSAAPYTCHPTLLDGCFQVFSFALPESARDGLKLPVRIDQVTVWSAIPTEVWCHVLVRSSSEWAAAADIRVYDRAGNVLIGIDGFRVQRASAGATQTPAKGPRVYSTEWKPDLVQAPRSAQGTTWLVFADPQGVADALRLKLNGRGATVTTVSRGTAFAGDPIAGFTIDAADASHVERLLHALPSRSLNVLHLFSFDVADPDSGAEQFDEDTLLSVRSPLYVMKALAGQQRVVPGTVAFARPTRPNSAGLLGLGRVAANELRNNRIKLINLPEHPSGPDIEGVVDELLSEDAEVESVWRDGERFVRRLQDNPSLEVRRLPRRDVHAFRLASPHTGSIDGLQWVPAERRLPQSGEVEIEVTHAGLNFRDVLKGMGLYPASTADELELGDECAGVVSAVGQDVVGLHPGDRVMACAAGCFRSHVTAPAAFVLPIPAGWESSAAATVPIAFLTAWYSLYKVARLTRGESVLIHAAAGGVGLAAVQLARRAGARIFATAGNEEKRALLRELGCELVMDSRALNFAGEIAAYTTGRGVDVILNSLAGEALVQSLRCLAPFGRFLELGKRDLFTNSKMGLWPLRNNASFHAIDVGAVLKDLPETAAQLLKELRDALDAGDIRPLPRRVWPASSATEAFRTMSQSKHTGKLVLDVRDSDLTITTDEVARVGFLPTATYVVSGGLGGFGLETAKWIIKRGGRHVVLLSRRGTDCDDAQRALTELRSLGAEPLAIRCDVADRSDVGRAMEELHETKPPVRGLFHAAAVIDDAPLSALREDRLDAVLRAKALGAWNLHEATRELELDHFVLFSSVSATVGNPGQGNYAAANAVTEELARYRRSIGLPATAVAWGFVTDVGFAAQRAELLTAANRHGFLGSRASAYLDVLERLLPAPPAVAVVGEFDWNAVSESLGDRPVRRVLSSFVSERATAGTAVTGGSAVRATVANAAPEERAGVVRDYVRAQVGRILGIAPAKVDADRPIVDLGLDSLMGIELATAIEQDLAVALASMSASREVTVNHLVHDILTQVGCSAPLRPVLSPRLEVDPITIVRNGGSRTPLICLHPMGGGLKTYQALAHALSPEIPVYGVQSRMLAGAEEHASLAAMADAYSAAVEDFLPAGPYRLFGFSLGGYVAASVAQRLEAAGRQVEFVGIADCPAWAAPGGAEVNDILARLLVSSYEDAAGDVQFLKPLQDSHRCALHEISRRLVNAQNDGIDILLDWFSANDLLAGGVPRESMRQLLERLSRHLVLFGSVTEIPEVRAPLHVWQATKGIGAGPEVWNHGNGSRAAGTLVDADHVTIMKTPAVLAIADQINTLYGL